MSELKFPNESRAYRTARNALLKEEQRLVDRVNALAARRRKLPLGGEVKDDYTFEWADEGRVGKPVKFSELFGDKPTLIVYSFMFGPSWDKPCLSCTSLVDGFDRTAYQVGHFAGFVAMAKAPAEKIHAFARQRGWTQIGLVSGFHSTFQRDYKCQQDSDDMQLPMLHVFRKKGRKIFHFWGTELPGNHVDTVWPYWNLMDFTPEGRPDAPLPPQTFRSRFLEDHLMSGEENRLMRALRTKASRTSGRAKPAKKTATGARGSKAKTKTKTKTARRAK
jgi:predicted dithiol-disulfide oxidoreductase (DUF899 family)